MRKTLSTRRFAITALIVTFLVAGALSLFASTSPDGLERVAADTGVLGTATDHGAAGAPLAGYHASFIGGRLGQSVAGIVGVILVLALFGGLTRLLRRREPTR
jgi:cobalt/nickel transport system permease protein/cobalt/nickel transport protein